MERLKEIVINDYLDYIKRLEKGYKDDYKHILDKINFIEIYEDYPNNFILEYLCNL